MADAEDIIEAAGFKSKPKYLELELEIEVDNFRAGVGADKARLAPVPAQVDVSKAKITSPHGVTFGISRAGKEVSKARELARLLALNPDLAVICLDPKGLMPKTAKRLGGMVLNMSTEAPDKDEKRIHFNFLDRFAIANSPKSFEDLSVTLMAALSLMQKQPLAPNEQSSTHRALNRLVRHYELGESLTPLLVAGLKNRFFEQLHLEEFGRLDIIRETLEAIYTQLRSDHAIPRTGYLVQPVRDRTSGLPRPVFSTPELERTYYRERAKGAGRSDTLAAQDAAIELIVLNTYSEGGRNLYAGEGQLRVQIPLLAYDKIERYVLARKNGGELDRSAWLALSLMRYLADPDQPRRQAPARVAPANSNSEDLNIPPATSDPELAGIGVGAEWRIPRLHPDSPVSDLATNAGPVWYAEDGWAEELAQEFAVQCGDCGLFSGLNKEETSICMRDLLVELRYGTPILSDLLAVLASEPYGYDLVKNLEIFVDPDVSGPLFNGHTNVNVFNRFIVFAVKNVNDELRPLRMMQCMELSWRLITSNSNTGLNKSYMMLVDEFGVVANQAPEVATYVGLMYKRSRAFGCAMWLMDQEPLSAQTLAGKQAISNSGIIELMRQKRDDLVSYWQPLFQLTPEEVDMISNFGPGEVMIILNEESRIRKVRAKYTMSDSMLKILSTKLDDVRQYISSQQEARGVKGDPLAEMLEELMGHSFEEAS